MATSIAAGTVIVPNQQLAYTTPGILVQGAQGTIPVGPSTRLNQGSVSPVGSVFSAGPSIGTTSLPTSIDFVLDNSAGVAPANFLLFDALGLFAANNGGTFVAATSASSSVAGITSMSQGSPILFKGFNYEVTVSATQFANPFTQTFGDVDGTQWSKPVQSSQAKRNTQFVSTLLTFEIEFYIDAFRGILLTVATGETVNLSLFTNAGFNRQ